MRFRLTQDFLQERERFSLVHNCEHCAHLNPKTAECVHGYPNAEHVEASLGQREGELVFCKEFELL